MDSKILDFGAALLDSGDLDPVYAYLAEQYPCMPQEARSLKRWLLAYSMFYHVGVANYLSENQGPHFWKSVWKDLDKFPRGEERRHFRGKQARRSIEWMDKFAPEVIVDSWYSKRDFQSVSNAVQIIPIYGPWVAFKLADLGERVLRIPIDFSNCLLGVYSEPRAGAALVYHGDYNASITDKELSDTVAYITDSLNAKGYKAPPWYDRPLNIQEAETCLCKFKSYMKGHYWIGQDIAAVEKALEWTLST